MHTAIRERPTPLTRPKYKALHETNNGSSTQYSIHPRGLTPRAKSQGDNMDYTRQHEVPAMQNHMEILWETCLIQTPPGHGYESLSSAGRCP